MRTLVAVLCAVGLASSTGNVSHLPSDYRANPTKTRSTNRQGTYRSFVREGQENNFAYFEFEHSQRE